MYIEDDIFVNPWDEFIENFDINDIPEFMREKQCVDYAHYSFISTIYDEDDEIYESYEEDEIEYNQKQTKLIENVFEELRDDYNLSDWQFYVEDGNKVVNCIARHKKEPVTTIGIIIPNIEDNIKIIENVMSKNGYYVAKIFNKPDKIKNVLWKVVIFNPEEQYPYNNVLKEEGYKYLIHSAPIVYKDTIEKVGIWPRDSKVSGSFKYAERTFFAVQDTKETNTEKYEIMMSSRAKRMKDINPSREFVVYIIEVSEIIDKISFFRDPNFKGACYTKQTISPKYLKNFYIRKY